MPTSRNNPLPTSRASRVRVALGVSPMTAAISLVNLPVPSDSASTIAWSVSSSAGRVARVVKIVTRNRVAIDLGRSRMVGNHVAEVGGEDRVLEVAGQDVRPWFACGENTQEESPVRQWWRLALK